VAESIESVNGLLALFHKQLDRPDISEKNAATYKSYIQGLETAKAEILQLRDRNAELERRLEPLPTRLGDLSDLPPELIDELTTPRADELETQIIDVIRAYGDTADLDQVLVGLYRKFGVVQKRRFLQNKVWRMAQKGALWSIKGRKGVYTLHEPDEADKDDAEQAPEDDDEIPF